MYELPRWFSAKESACQFRRCRRLGFDPWDMKIPWSGKWQPPPVFLSGKFHEQRSLAGYSLWGCQELAVTEHACNTHMHMYLCILWLLLFPFFCQIQVMFILFLILFGSWLVCLPWVIFLWRIPVLLSTSLLGMFLLHPVGFVWLYFHCYLSWGFFFFF